MVKQRPSAEQRLLSHFLSWAVPAGTARLQWCRWPRHSRRWSDWRSMWAFLSVLYLTFSKGRRVVGALSRTEQPSREAAAVHAAGWAAPRRQWRRGEEDEEQYERAGWNQPTTPTSPPRSGFLTELIHQTQINSSNGRDKVWCCQNHRFCSVDVNSPSRKSERKRLVFINVQNLFCWKCWNFANTVRATKYRNTCWQNEHKWAVQKTL